MNETELYYDHYKDTFSYLRQYLQMRDRYILFSLLTLALIFMQVNLPKETASILDAIIQKHLGPDVNVGFNSINTLLLIVLLGIVIKYFQTNLHIERSYDYLHKVEEKLTSELNDFEITREGKSYLKNYPIFLTVVHWIYTIAFPLLLIFCLIQKLISECRAMEASNNSGIFALNIVIILLVITVTALYLMWIHCRDFKADK